MFNFFRVNTYTVDGLKNMRSSIDRKRARYEARIMRENTLLTESCIRAIEARRESVDRMEQEIQDLKELR